MGFGETLKMWFDDALRIVYPKVCEVCGVSLGRGENVVCLHCLQGLPRTNLHTADFNLLHERLAGKAPIERAGGYFYYYRKSDYARLIHYAKYNGRPVIAERLGERYAREIYGDGFFDGVDLLLPVPLHWWKLVKRGYNQSEAIARGVSRVTGIAIGNNIVAMKSHSTQTAKGQYSRWKNTEGIYAVENVAALEGRHVLVIDDVITTGSTLLRCCEAIHVASPTTRISVLTLAVANNV